MSQISSTLRRRFADPQVPRCRMRPGCCCPTPGPLALAEDRSLNYLGVSAGSPGMAPPRWAWGGARGGAEI